MFKNLKSKILGGLVGFVAVAGAALAVNVYQAGYNPNTNQYGISGVPVAGGAVPVVTGTCGTIGAVVGGTNRGEITTAAVTSCAITLTVPTNSIVVSGGTPGVAMPNRLACTLKDITTPSAQAVYASTPTTTSCTFTALTITAGDHLAYSVDGY